MSPTIAIQPGMAERLAVIAETTIGFVKANIEAGVSGFFYATQCGSRDIIDDRAFAELCRPYDLQVANAFVGKTWFNVLHIHGRDILFDELSRYPCEVINWHDRQTAPTIKEARAKCGKVFLGGLHEGPSIAAKTLVYDSIMAKSGSTPETIKAHIREAIEMAGGKGLIVGPGCVADPRSPEENIRAVREAVDR